MKKTKRIKITPPEIVVTNRSDADLVLHNIALATASKIRITADMDAEIQTIKARCADDLAACDASIKEGTQALSVWASANPHEFPKGLKSLALSAGRIGFRTATPSLQLLNRKWNWEKVTKAVQSIMPAFIRDHPAVDKEGLLAQRDEEIIKTALPMVGLKIDQGESFYVEPDLTPVQTRQVQEAA